MKRTIEINDTLEERVESAIDSVKQELLDFLEANPDQDELPCLNNDLDYSGAIHEIIDGSVPIYTSELEDNWYLHSSELEQALDNAGLYSGDDLVKLERDQRIASAFYCYIQEQVNEWYNDEAQAVFNEWDEGRTFTSVVDDTGAHITDPNGNVFQVNKDLLESDDFDLEDHLKDQGFMPKHGRLEEG